MRVDDAQTHPSTLSDYIAVVARRKWVIRQALINVFVNALQAMPEQGGEILLSASRDGNRVKIDVSDTDELLVLAVFHGARSR